MHTVPLTHQLVTIQDDFDLDKSSKAASASGRRNWPTGATVFFPAAHSFI